MRSMASVAVGEEALCGREVVKVRFAIDRET